MILRSHQVYLVYKQPVGHCLLTAVAPSPVRPGHPFAMAPLRQVAFTGWCLTGGLSALTGPLRGIRRAAICSAVYLAPWVGGGADVPVVNILKHIFRRIRPSAIAHTTYAFPSGCE